jgi:hypothetical protein
VEEDSPSSNIKEDPKACQIAKYYRLIKTKCSGKQSISIATETHYTKQPKHNQPNKGIREIHGETQCTLKSIKTSKDIYEEQQWTKHPEKQNDSTRNFIIQPTSWNKHDGWAITSKTVVGLHKTQLSKTLVNTPDMPSTTGIHKQTTILDIQKARQRTPR